MELSVKLRNTFVASMLSLAAMHLPANAQSAAPDEAARAALPEDVRESGVLRVATSLQWAPFAYRSEDNEPVGIDISLMRLLAGKLGLEFELEDMRFPSIIPSVSSGRYHAGVNQMSMTPERMAAVDMIPYFHTGSVVLVRAGNTVEDVADLCGMDFVVTQGSLQMTQLEALSTACVERGAAPITQQLYPSSADTLLAISNGRGDAFMTAAPQALYIASVNSQVEVVEGEVPNVPRWPAGIIVQKGNDAMREALALALESAIEDGSYGAILEENSVSASAVTVEEVRASVD